ncbi:hypothetical protein B0H63DRAFT_518225 [Podospora didyma]|uniref:Uncharacterized protein n=1 Tax=Podospora didyma TaxID=330526 RepID=A0AAE0P8A2_9PEZI|nr:hypothetical protein B0H63DRAFT_518225 [Podospora didyma]
MSASRAIASISSASRSTLATAPLTRLPLRTLPARQVRSINTKEPEGDLGGPGGSEPPGPKPNPYNWWAGSATAAIVLLVGWRMTVAKSKEIEGAAKKA